jgi:4-amino-4-deoxy-L-arabinose transferase-like glycosyltransferase
VKTSGTLVAESSSPQAPARDRSRFWWLLAAIALLAFAIRLWVVLTLAHRNPNGGDPFYYHVQANLLADNKGFSEPFTFSQTGRLIPTAFHPPLFSMLLAVSSFFGGTSFFAHKLMACLAGTGTVVVVGLLARALAGNRAGLIAAGFAAVYPNLWIVDGILMPESLYGLSIAVVLLAAYRYRRDPRLRPALATGVAIGLAVLVRGEAVVLVPVLAVPLALCAGGDRAHRVRQLGAMLLAVALVVAPWTLRNLARLDRPVLSVNGDEVIGIANCHDTYYGPFLGFWSIRCYNPTPPGGEVDRGAAYRKRGIDYARGHLSRLPYVLLVRQGRMWDVYRPRETVLFGRIEGRDANVTRIGQRIYWTALPIALIGLVLLRRRRRPILPLVAQLVMVAITGVLAYGTVRFRMPAEVVLVVLVGVTLDALFGSAWLRGRFRSRVPAARSSAAHP